VSGRLTPWIAVDLDGTLAEYHGWVAPDNIGKPIPAMVARVKAWLAEGKDVRIFTARGSIDEADRAIAYPAIERWCKEHIGYGLPITNVKDVGMVELWDDRAVQVASNVGEPVTANLMDGVAALVKVCYDAAVAGGWWHDVNTGEPLKRNRGELLCLMHSEISEAMEAERKNLMDDKLPHRRGAEVELADAVIRIADYCGAHGYDLAGAIVEKLAYNAKRADHKPEARRAAGGKAF